MEQERQGNLLVALVLGVGAALFCALVAKATGIALFDSGEVTTQIIGEVHERACIAQYGPMERWTRHAHVYECARGTYDVPATAMSYPLGAQ